MKRLLTMMLLMLCAAGAGAATTNTNVVVFALLKAAPEKFRGKKVVYVERFSMFLTSMPDYMVRSGIKESSHFLLVVGDPQLPVIIRKNAKVIETVAALKAGTMLRVSGRLREFDVEPRRGMLPPYYIDADEVSPDKGAPPEPPNPGGWFNQDERPPMNPYQPRRGRGAAHR